MTIPFTPFSLTRTLFPLLPSPRRPGEEKGGSEKENGPQNSLILTLAQSQFQKKRKQGAWESEEKMRKKLGKVFGKWES